ncbi:GNAT family N-acetyltransferase [Nitratireductor pacificus]|uniref:N-acetyltransferase GCN5 n=1 Tax=Nitratireductor pacificus pht-3B TaxID=391937 RepID=K2MSL9_9HYPH|nr:GNAT family N-acetyltransferase [Nitratireductor pacificus]EKF20382.1 N-acetyltransferase GCN5 [Nitratireductor pacificus pht-3B]
MPFEIRPAEPGDIEALLAIENAAFAGDRLSRRSMRALIGRPSAIALVAIDGADIAGYAIALLNRLHRVARLYSIAVSPVRTGRGVAGALLHAVEAEAGNRRRRAMRLEVREDNRGAIALYERNGYRRFARRDNYYHDGMSALRYEKQLRGTEDGERP